MATKTFKALLAAYEASGDSGYVKELRAFMVVTDYLAAGDTDTDLLEVLERTRTFLHPPSVRR